MDDTRRWRIDSAESHHPLSAAERAAYAQLRDFSRSPELDFDQLVEAVEPLPRLRHRLLRLANSLHRSPVQTISNLKHALVFMGAEGIREAAETALRQPFWIDRRPELDATHRPRQQPD